MRPSFARSPVWTLGTRDYASIRDMVPYRTHLPAHAHHRPLIPLSPLRDACPFLPMMV